MSNLNNFILREVGKLNRCVQSISNINLKEINLQKGQFIYLTEICEHPGINQKDLTNILKVDKTSTSKAVKKLKKIGYIKRVKDEDDKRVWNLYPTAKGKKIYKVVIAEENRNLNICLTDFNEQEKELIYNLVKRMRENIEVDWHKIKMDF
ncbi:MarR family winged helix-turn-helix transcriptional regulator [Selenihalanaerobacter shriftii]|uniref:DNA-binding transcriptional regulator, MarR family n=1 Tax=Selenihalanaerobacter shriftii TaxID=142842 RepID=A0A1T4PK32_9FIRM|nr:MarR family winged helix-turn-helix transcriptional regulator [Selenihalanaerobacter shriftii]SJZ91920.1 DNA-binding transcriptional regulator, MarR family [Selenihalanaerobacter shriftii]